MTTVNAHGVLSDGEFVMVVDSSAGRVLVGLFEFEGQWRFSLRVVVGRYLGFVSPASVTRQGYETRDAALDSARELAVDVLKDKAAPRAHEWRKAAALLSEVEAPMPVGLFG
ncbi:MAG: hypothetical protein DRJ65_00240 [Acidobacteria bacterium]|nr:MAG: hypothetical protein DRJ65_00240 [Acidobacteriota bacterium]